MNNKTNSNIIKAIVIFVLCLLVYNLLAFMIPFVHGSLFAVCYIFGLVAFLGQIPIAFLAYRNADTTKKKLYAYPIVQKGAIYLCIQFVFTFLMFTVNTFTDKVPVWIPSVVCVLLLCLFTVLVLLTDTARENVEKIEAETEEHMNQVKVFKVNIDSIMRRVEDKSLLRTLERLNDVARYSDPVSSPAVVEIENGINAKIGELDMAVRMGNVSYAKSLAGEIIDLFEDRNAICKAEKGR